MIKIDLLKNHPQAIPTLAYIWHEVLGMIWMPEIGIEEILSLYDDELNQDFPLTLIALSGEIPVGSCTLQLTDDLRADLGPWIADLAVKPNSQKQGIGKMLLSAMTAKAKDFGFQKQYLFTFDPTLEDYYQRLGWHKIGMDQYKSHPVTLMRVEL